MEDIDQRITQLEQMITEAPVPFQRDLKKLMVPIYAKRTSLSIEGIECRKRDRPTLSYTEYLNEFNELADNFEKYVMLAALMRG